MNMDDRELREGEVLDASRGLPCRFDVFLDQKQCPHVTFLARRGNAVDIQRFRTNALGAYYLHGGDTIARKCSNVRAGRVRVRVIAETG